MVFCAPVLMMVLGSTDISCIGRVSKTGNSTIFAAQKQAADKAVADAARKKEYDYRSRRDAGRTRTLRFRRGIPISCNATGTFHQQR